MSERFYNFPVPNRIVTSAPTRIDLAGGTIDIWPIYLFHPGACTLNAAISLRAHAEIEPRTDGRVDHGMRPQTDRGIQRAGAGVEEVQGPDVDGAARQIDAGWRGGGNAA